MEASRPAAPERLLEPGELEVVAAFGVPRSLPEGGRIFAAGEVGRSMFFVLEGEVELVLAGGSRRKTLGAGVFFGELALLLAGEGRSGDAVARRGTRLLELDERGFASLAAAHPALAITLLVRSARALLDSERRLVAELEARNRELERTLDYLRRTREELSSAELQAQTDPLTGLYNRRCLDAQLPRLVERAVGGGPSLAVILLDLDRFKLVNDTYGHAGGDAVLRAVAAQLRAAVRWSDLPCRIGGDELAVVLVDIPSPAAAVARARAIFDTLADLAVELAGERVSVGTSHGGAFLRPGETPEELLRRADAALYAAKACGRGALVWEGELVASRPGRD
ncbi:MAG TPA: GGDEF domain-containing protein [Thermoanaerobaculaceae bacterium]|nr:GGDEF domain-containing protein [Thermoanaerobaculaceae bacterium]HRS15379.1 GGDEF domain-containing protein [Thermoanaerobaculaceae bacterium]